MSRLNPNKVGISVGGVLGAYHLCWALLVAAGWAQPFIDFILWLHFIKPFIVVEPFSAVRAAGLVVVTALIAYAFGWIFALIWNRMRR